MDIHIKVQGKNQVISLDRLNTDKMLEDAKRRFEEAKNAATDQLLQNTAAHNNEGIAYEKAGQEDEAIAIYENNIADGYPAIHAFDRLMKIYRHRKKYRDECRVIRRAIEIFTAENQRRAERAITDEPTRQKEISEALLSCRKVIGSHGFYCFVPYDVVALRERLRKAEILSSKQGEK